MNYLEKLKAATAKTGKQYSNLVGEVPASVNSRLPQLNRTYRVKIVNSTNIAATYVVGGFNDLGDGNSAGSDAGIAITTNVGTQGTHGALKREMQNMNSTLVQMRYKTTTADNYDNTITYKTIRGSNQNITAVEPLNYQPPINNITTTIDIPDFNNMEWNGSTLLTGSMVANSTINFILSIGSIIDMANAAYGETVIKSTSQPAPPQISAANSLVQMAGLGTGYAAPANAVAKG